MIEIKNEELYDNLPRFTENQFQQHTPESMVYKAMSLTGDHFWANDIRKIMKREFDIEMSSASAGRALRSLWEHGFVKRVKVQNMFVYDKTPLYKNVVE